MPVAFTEDDLHQVFKKARMVHPRCEPVLELLYSTGARINEAAGIMTEDISSTHIVLKETKWRPGGPQGRTTYPAGEGRITPELTAAFDDPVVRAARTAELVAIAVVIGLMVLQPF